MKALINRIRRSGNGAHRFFLIITLTALTFLTPAADAMALSGEDQKTTTGSSSWGNPLMLVIVIASLAVVTVPFVNEWRIKRNKSRTEN